MDFIVRDYVRTACPVSSLRISERKSMDLSPASIRNIMLELDEDGLLHQPHTSAGRAPTEKGYKYFVDNLMEERNVPESAKADFNKIFSEFFGENMFDELASLLAQRLGLFSGIVANGRIFKRGFAEVLREPEFKEHDFLVEFAEFTDNIEDNIGNFEGINIGNFSVVSSKFGPNHIVFSVGPARMDYEKALSFIKYLTKSI